MFSGRKKIALSLIVMIAVISCNLLSTVQEPAEEVPAVEAIPTQTEIPVDVNATNTVIANTIKQTQEAQNQIATAEAEKAQMDAIKTATQAAILSSTETASRMYTQIQSLYDQGTIKTTEGAYHPVDDFDKSWAQINWYRWWYTGYQPQNFVIRADATWETASSTANWFSCGCGFVYNEIDESNHHMSFLGLDGKVHTYRSQNNRFTEMTGGYYGKVGTPDGEAELMLVVEDGWITFFVNQNQVVRFQDTSLKSGNLGLTLNSGTNKDYGFRCQMKNIDLWVLP